MSENSPCKVFLDNAHKIKLGDFGLSRVLDQASLAKTFVGVRHVFIFPLMKTNGKLIRLCLTCPQRLFGRDPTIPKQTFGLSDARYMSSVQDSHLFTVVLHTWSSRK